ncbi:MAG: GNAT family N-acetyltransferase [Ruminococcus sp.]|nr:GNAT family N-acetyltransferase [Ruminococcus sp.]
MDHKGTVTLETERLILRRFTPEDAQDAFCNWMSSKVVTKYLTWQPHQSVEESKEYIQSVISSCENPDHYNWAIEFRELGQVIGAIGVNEIFETVAACEIGYCLGDRFWGRGIMPEALREVIRFLFEEVGMNRIQATHDVNNPQSGRVMEKCGLRYEGTMRQAGKNNQGICDSVMRAILKSDWLSDH